MVELADGGAEPPRDPPGGGRAAHVDVLVLSPVRLHLRGDGLPRRHRRLVQHGAVRSGIDPHRPRDTLPDCTVQVVK